MQAGPPPPKAYEAFVHKFPKLGQAWDLLTEAGQDGPLDEKTVRLLKLAIAIGAMREGAVRANVRKGLAAGLSSAEIDQVLALAASTIGLPATVAVFTWVDDLLAGPKADPV